MGGGHSRYQINGGKISSGELRHGGMCGPIGVGIFATCDKRYRTGVRGAGIFLQETFLPSLFFGKSKTLPPIVGTLSTLSVKKSGMVLHNPVTSAKEKYNSSLRALCKLIGAVTGK